ARRDSRDSIASYSAADILRGKRIPVPHRIQDPARAQRKMKKLEYILYHPRAGGSSYSLSGLVDAYEDTVLHELDMVCVKKFKNDDIDISAHPSYNLKNFKDLNSFVAYLDAKTKYDQQFLREMEFLISSQRKICDEYFLKRILCYKTLWPPLHTQQEVDRFVTKFFQLPPKQKARVEFLMKNKLS
ncbi:hypothetical protein KR018_011656, partial [Drosophila ironensis]